MAARSIHATLTRHFLRRFLENDLISPEADRAQLLAVVGAALFSVTLMTTLFMSFGYVSGGWTPGSQYPAAPAPAWSATIALNLTAPMELSQLVLAPMAERGGGAVVNVASVGGLRPAPGIDMYGASKAMLIRLTESLAVGSSTPPICRRRSPRRHPRRSL